MASAIESANPEAPAADDANGDDAFSFDDDEDAALAAVVDDLAMEPDEHRVPTVAELEKRFGAEFVANLRSPDELIAEAVLRNAGGAPDEALACAAAAVRTHDLSRRRGRAVRFACHDRRLGVQMMAVFLRVKAPASSARWELLARVKSGLGGRAVRVVVEDVVIKDCGGRGLTSTVRFDPFVRRGANDIQADPNRRGLPAGLRALLGGVPGDGPTSTASDYDGLKAILDAEACADVTISGRVVVRATASSTGAGLLVRSGCGAVLPGATGFETIDGAGRHRALRAVGDLTLRRLRVVDSVVTQPEPGEDEPRAARSADGDVRAWHCEFRNCSAGTYTNTNGMVFWEWWTVTRGLGGAIFAVAHVAVGFTNFTGCRADDGRRRDPQDDYEDDILSGGAIHSSGCSVKLANVRAARNAAANDGGFLDWAPYTCAPGQDKARPFATVADAVFEDHAASGGGQNGNGGVLRFVGPAYYWQRGVVGLRRRAQRVERVRDVRGPGDQIRGNAAPRGGGGAAFYDVRDTREPRLPPGTRGNDALYGPRLATGATALGFVRSAYREASGVVFNASVEARVLDLYGSVVATSDGESVLLDVEGAELTGDSKGFTVAGRAVFRGVTLTRAPNASLTLRAEVVGAAPRLEAAAAVVLRACVAGAVRRDERAERHLHLPRLRGGLRELRALRVVRRVPEARDLRRRAAPRAGPGYWRSRR
ncbi:hypothetical protein SO694_00054278 [Aureococcus anophagefferens]|uniref:Right handed beta helix domain-containing protein n=1 Tax=Aureococcus anophagefferens TaxID=44056 RepID=A0ABR1FXT0_AURAN